MPLNRPQDLTEIQLNIGYFFPLPQTLYPLEPSPGVETEIIEETPGVFDALIYDEGAGSSGFVLVEEV